MGLYGPTISAALTRIVMPSWAKPQVAASRGRDRRRVVGLNIIGCMVHQRPIVGSWPAAVVTRRTSEATPSLLAKWTCFWANCALTEATSSGHYLCPAATSRGREGHLPGTGVR